MSKPITYDWNGHTDMPVSYPHLTDFQMAGKVRMLMRYDHDHEGVVMGARDRIMGLSKLADKQRALIETLTKTLASVKTWAEQSCPCHEETPNPCPLCGASVENLEACKAVDHTFPRDIKRDIFAALAAAKEQSA